MRHPPLPRRAVLGGLLAASAVRPVRAQPEIEKITPTLVAAAVKEGKVSHYTSDDLVQATAMAKAFEAKYPGIRFQLERTGAERVYQRVMQEYASNVHVADVVSSADLSFIVAWKGQGMLTRYMPEEAMGGPAEARDPDGYYLTDNFTLVVPGYNTRQVKAEEAPKSWADLLDPKWKGRMAKGHPSYSGTIMNGTYALANTLGWEYFEKLGKQAVMQLQSAGDPPQRVAQGERAIMADCSENTAIRLIGTGAPLGMIYPPEGIPVVPIGTAIMAKPANPNAARVLVHFLSSREGQQLRADYGSRTFHPQVAMAADRKPTAEMKLLFNDPVALARDAEMVKKQYTRYFGT
jgi:iron(III) transport system substrate-binding protein